ncbi:lysoplasmalogenase family protein [Pontivivens insulae]|uniref:YhhN-like protein n=1 Tax=Pontivivens insulae TaxID=1639689 RepID=A0A2R8ACN6_9RHOB|nr:lysoplasmalogenase family protein [Pontivivens insulae]RED13937.1 YhhN-like protein [Pontivivens insulae]SPF30011.1 hypothetical protein POI8812_02339 [Pontivivens insulae]
MTAISYLFAILSVACSAAYVGYFQMAPVSRARLATKTGATACLAIFAFTIGSSFILVTALALATVADAMKASRSEHGYVGSMGIFLFVNLLIALDIYVYHWVGFQAIFVQVAALVGICAGYTILIWPYLGAHRKIVLPYTVSVLLIFILAMGSSMDAAMLKVGAVLIVICNGLLGIEMMMFNRSYMILRMLGPVIWLSYYFGLVLVVLGTFPVNG